MAVSACPDCGAVLSPGATRCDLCGAVLTAETPDPAAEVTVSGGVPTAQPVPAAEPAEGVCGACGHQNLAGARYCNACGNALDEAGAAPSAPRAELPGVSADQPAVRPPSDPGRRALALVGIALLAVVGLYAITRLSTSPGPSDALPEQAVAPGPGAAPVGPVPAGPAAVSLPDSLEARLADLEDTGTAQSWAEAGRLLFEVALLAQAEGARAAFARQAVDAFDRSLALSDDPDVRTNLAAAALYDPRNPMRAVQELQAVLGADPDHVEANFNMGLMRMRIGRMEQAAESFRRVVALTSPAAPVHQEALRALESVEQARPEGG